MIYYVFSIIYIMISERDSKTQTQQVDKNFGISTVFFCIHIIRLFLAFLCDPCARIIYRSNFGIYDTLLA